MRMAVARAYASESIGVQGARLRVTKSATGCSSRARALLDYPKQQLAAATESVPPDNQAIGLWPSQFAPNFRCRNLLRDFIQNETLDHISHIAAIEHVGNVRHLYDENAPAMLP